MKAAHKKSHWSSLKTGFKKQKKLLLIAIVLNIIGLGFISCYFARYYYIIKTRKQLRFEYYKELPGTPIKIEEVN